MTLKIGQGNNCKCRLKVKGFWHTQKYKKNAERVTDRWQQPSWSVCHWQTDGQTSTDHFLDPQVSTKYISFEMAMHNGCVLTSFMPRSCSLNFGLVALGTTHPLRLSGLNFCCSSCAYRQRVNLTYNRAAQLEVRDHHLYY